MHGTSTSLLAVVAFTIAQEPQPHVQPQQPAPAVKPPVRVPSQAASPFAPDAELRAVLGAERPAADGFQPLDDRPVLPEMHLRGIVRLVHKDRPAALIEVAGFGTYTARQGDSIAFTLPTSSLRMAAARTGGNGAAAPNQASAATAVDDLRKTSDQRAAGAAPAAAGAANATGRGPASTGVVVSSQIPIVLRVVRVDRDGVVVEIGTLGQLMVIR